MLLSSYDKVCDWAYGVARRRLTPDLRNSHYAYRDAVRTALAGRGCWLDIGCGHAWLPSWMPADQRELELSRWTTVGVDLDYQSIRRHAGLRWRLLGNVERLPFHDYTFDLITANMVVEHVADPVSLFAELGRVLRPGGTLIVHTPNAFGYTTALARLVPESLLAPLAQVLLARRQEDVYPTYYRANSFDALQSAATTGGLDVRSFDFVASSPQFFRFPPLMAVELLAMRHLENPRRAQYRACILATFRKREAENRR